MSEIQFQEPAPLVPRRPESRADFAATLRKNPGKWALFGQHSSSECARQDAYLIRRAKNPQNAGFSPAGAFETVARDLFGEHRVYIRFVGEQS